MKEINKYSETDRLVCYKERTSGGGYETSMIFNKETKSVDVTVMAFHGNENSVPSLEPMSEWEKYSADKGEWRIEPTCLGLEDIEFMHNKAKELFE